MKEVWKGNWRGRSRYLCFLCKGSTELLGISGVLVALLVAQRIVQTEIAEIF